MAARGRKDDQVTLDELKAHLDGRLDAQDKRLGAIEVSVGKLEATLEEKVKSADKEHGSMKEACGARHGSTSKRVGRLEALVGVGALAAVGAFCKVVWDAATGSKGS